MRSSQPWKTNRSRALRSNASSAEDQLWAHLRNRQLNGFKFVRQAPAGRYFADFLCRQTKLIIEVDGGTHCEPHERMKDARRTRELQNLGYQIHRIYNNDVYDNIDRVLDQIVAMLKKEER